MGLWYMAGGWSLIIAGLAAPIVLLLALRRRRVTRAVVAVAALAVLGVLMLGMMKISRADARGDDLLATDGPVRVAAVAGQVVFAALAVGAAAARGRELGRRSAVAYGAAVGGAALGAVLASVVPNVFFVVVVGLVAARFAFLTVDDDPTTPSRPGRPAAFLFTWSVAVLALETQLLASTSGIGLTAAAFVLGLVVLASRASNGTRVGLAGVATLTFLPVLFGLTLLMPSLPGSRFLLDIGLASPDGLELEGELTRDGQLERWYSIRSEDATDGVDAVGEAFRSPPVSVWPHFRGGATGHLFGYRLVVSGFDQGERTPVGSPCSTETRSCIRVAVERSQS